MSQFNTKLIVGARESVTDEILLLNPHQTPLLSLLGFSEAIANVEHSWFEDEMFADESTADGAKLVGDTEIVVADAEPFAAGQVIKIGEELLLVSAVNPATKTLTVSRGYAGTTAAAIADGAKVEVQFNEGQEGREARAGRGKKRVRKSNITQIFDETVEITGTAAAVAQHGIDDLYEYEKQKKQLELALQLEKALINGVKFENGDIRQMDGIRSFIKTNIAAAGGALTYDMINDQIQKIYEAGGMASGANHVILVGAKQKRKISAFDASKIQLAREDQKRGTIVDVIVSDFGEVPVALNNNLAPDELLIVDLNRVSVHPLQGRDFSHEFLGKKGDYVQGQILGEYTLQFKQEKGHARIKGLS